jgi:hypothetical protein
MTTSGPDLDRLAALGEALHAATAAELAGEANTAAEATHTLTRRQRRRRRRGPIVAAVAAVVVGVPGAAIAANALIGSDEVARSIPNGTLALLGTHPSCTVVTDGVEFDCTLATPPRGELAPGAWKGTVEPTVDDTRHVNGGCRSLNPAGTHWRCYVGQAAVDQKIVARSFLGQPSDGPGVG